MPSFAVAVLVGPDNVEVERLLDLVSSVEVWEPRPAHWILIDDGPQDRELLHDVRKLLPPGSDAIALRYPRPRNDTRRLLALGAGTLLALSYAQAHTQARFTLKLDTDALVIGPFADAIERVIDRTPDAGVIGTLGDSCHPDRRDPAKLQKVSSLLTLMRLLPPPPPDIDDPRAVLQIEGLGTASVAELRAFAAVRPHIEQAVARGYRTRQYCQGGAYVVTRLCMDRMASAGYFDTPDAWNRVPVGEDVMMGMYAQATGLRLLDCCGDGEPFGVQYRGLPYVPEQLIARRYSLIHSLKNDPEHPEQHLRQYFARLRATARRANRAEDGTAS